MLKNESPPWLQLAAAILLSAALGGCVTAPRASFTAEEQAAASPVGFSHVRYNEDDPALADMLRAKAEAERQAAALLHQQDQELADRHGEGLTLKARLTEFAKDSGLDRALCQVWDATRSYGAWSRREDWSKHNKLNAQDIEGSDSLADTTSLRMTFDGVPFEFQTRKWSGFDNGSYVDITLLEAGEEVFALTATAHYNEHMTTYSPSLIKALKRQGTWANQLVKLNAMLEAQSKLMSAQGKYRNAEEINIRFKE